MKTVLAGIAAVALLAGASGAFAQDTTTVVHKTDGMGDSKTVVHHANGSKTVIHHHGMYTKKVHTSPNGDKTVVKTMPQ
jgi:hypothetical protein